MEVHELNVCFRKVITVIKNLKQANNCISIDCQLRKINVLRNTGDKNKLFRGDFAEKAGL